VVVGVNDCVAAGDDPAPAGDDSGPAGDAGVLAGDVCGFAAVVDGASAAGLDDPPHAATSARTATVMTIRGMVLATLDLGAMNLPPHFGDLLEQDE